MRYLALAVGLLLVAPPEARADFRNFRKNGQGQSSLALEFLPASGSGAPVVGDLCDTYASELTGNFFCLKGDGTQTNASTWGLVAQGTPTTRSLSVCPNGLNCGAVSMQAVNGSTDYWKTASQPIMSGADFSFCETLRIGSGGQQTILEQNGGSSSNRFFLYASGSGSTVVEIWEAGGATVLTSAAFTVGADYFVCLTFHPVASGSSVARLYVNGTETANSSVSKLPGGTSNVVNVGAAQGGATFLGTGSSGFLRNAIKTDKILSAATVAAMARTVLADTPVGTHNEALTFTRSSARVCDPSDGGVLTALPSDRPCVSGGLSIEPAATNLVLRNRDLSQGAWTKSNATCALTATGMDGASNSASTCTASAGNATVLQTLTVSANTRATSLGLRRRAGTGTVNVTRDNGGTWTAVTLTAAFQRFTPQTTAALTSGGANPVIGIQIVTNGDAVDVDFVQDEPGAFASSPIATAGTSVTRSSESADLTMPSRMVDTAGCVGLTVLIDHVPPNSFPRMLALSTNGYIYFGGTSTEVDAYDGTNFATANTGSTIAGASNRYMLDWSGATLTLTAAGVANATGYDGTIVGSTLNLGRYSSGAHLGGTISNVKLGTKAGVCN